MNKFMKLFVFTLFLPLSIALAGSLKGKVTNGTKGHKISTDVVVQLNKYVGGSQDNQFAVTAKVNKNGEYIFKNLPSEPNVSYEPMVTYQGVKYYGTSQPLADNNSTINSDVVIYEATKSNSDISIKVHHYIINPGQGFLKVKEMMLLENKGDRTYVGSTPTQSGKFITANYYLPAGASQVSLGQGLMSCCVEGSGKGFYDTMEILPGKKTISFTYRINSDKKDLDFIKELSLPTNELDVLVENKSVKLTSPQLKKMTAASTANMDNYSAQNLKAGEQVNINLAGLAGPPTNWSSITFGIAIAVLFLTGIFVFVKQKRNSVVETGTHTKVNKSSANRGTVVLSREDLLDEIVELDEQFKKGEIKENFYQLKRSELKEKLSKIGL